ncbi:hypothetical protein AB0C12_11385 [Actinoplanes sp. NPDC048967]|uniref:hypothetical protein n=1 Tax=Actinoplanes sp. NPDC048967 TaxID=3155269 RepID=UPI0033F7CD96
MSLLSFLSLSASVFGASLVPVLMSSLVSVLVSLAFAGSWVAVFAEPDSAVVLLLALAPGLVLGASSPAAVVSRSGRVSTLSPSLVFPSAAALDGLAGGIRSGGRPLVGKTLSSATGGLELSTAGLRDFAEGSAPAADGSFVD